MHAEVTMLKCKPDSQAVVCKVIVPPNICDLIPGTCEHVTLGGKWDFAEVMKLEISTWGESLGLSRWAQGHYERPYKGKRETRGSGEVTMEGEFEVMWKGCEPRNEAFRSLKRQGNEFSEASGRSISLPAHLGLLAPGTER